MTNATWKVQPHRPIEELEPNLWRVEGDLPGGGGTRVMTLARRRDGSLVVHSAIALEEDQMRRIEGFGRPELLVVPNGFHRIDAAAYKARYPGLRVVCPAGDWKRVSKAVAVDGTYSDVQGDEDVRLLRLEGTGDHEGVLEVRSPDGTTLVLNDVVNNLPPLRGFLSVMLSPSGRVCVPRIFRWFFVKNKGAFFACMERLAATPRLRRVIVSHGAMMTESPANALRSALTAF